MTVQSVLRKLGQWSIRLRPDAPPGVIGALDYFGHVAIVPGRIDAAERGDELLSLARYVGILRTVEASEQVTLSGVGMAAWLGDEDGKGDVIEAPGITLTGATFAASIAALLPAGGAVTAGTLTAIAGTYSATHTYQTPRSAIDYVCDLFGGEWRVNGDGTLDAGPPSALFRTTPECVIVRDGAGYDLTLKALPGKLQTERSAKDYTTRVVVVGEGLASGDADAGTVPYKDLHGNDVVWTRVVDEQDDTAAANAGARAQAVLNLFSGPRRSLRLALAEVDIAGDFEPGDVVWCYDPSVGLADTTYEVEYRGRLINPVPVRVLGLTWPVTEGHSVGYRDSDGVWTDLTPWVEWESPSGGEVEVADSLSSALTPGVGTIGTVVSGGGGGAGDTSVPDVPVFGAFTSSTYQPGDGLARAAVKPTWSQPLNTDASTIVDGDHYEIRYRPTGTTEWAIAYVGWDQLSTTITDLPPSTGFDWQIRAVDYYSPINYGAWSATTTYATPADTTPPGPPAPPTVAASQLAVQVTHTLGLAAGGTYNLPLDMDHFDVHVGTSSGFTPSAASLVGKLLANGAMVTGGIAAVGTYQVDTIVPAGSVAYVKVVAVDKTGNASVASSAASATAQLVDSAHISDLTATKITAGTISVAVTLSGSIKTGTSGARGEMDINGLRGYDSSGALNSAINFSTGALQIGSLTGDHILGDASGSFPTLWFRDGGSDLAFINSPGGGLGLNTASDGTTYGRLFLLPGVSELASKAHGTQTTLGGTVLVQPGGAFIEHRAAGSVLRGWMWTDANSAGIQYGPAGSYCTVTSSLARLFAPTGGNASVENGNGGYCSINGTAAYLHSAGGDIFIDKSGAGYWWATGSTIQSYATGFWDQGGVTARLQATGGTLSLLGTTVYLGNPSGQVVRSDATYNNTATFTANVGIATSPIGVLYRLTSSARYKVGIAELDVDPLRVLDLVSVTYYDRGQADAQGGSTDGLSQQVGLIAEQVAEVPDIGPLLVEMDADGRPESVNYERLAAVQQVLLRDLAERVTALEGKPLRVTRRVIPAKVLALSSAPIARPEILDVPPEPQAPPTPDIVVDHGPHADSVRDGGRQAPGAGG